MLWTTTILSFETCGTPVIPELEMLASLYVHQVYAQIDL